VARRARLATDVERERGVIRRGDDVYHTHVTRHRYDWGSRAIGDAGFDGATPICVDQQPISLDERLSTSSLRVGPAGHGYRLATLNVVHVPIVAAVEVCDGTRVIFDERPAFYDFRLLPRGHRGRLATLAIIEQNGSRVGSRVVFRRPVKKRPVLDFAEGELAGVAVGALGKNCRHSGMRLCVEARRLKAVGGATVVKISGRSVEELHQIHEQNGVGAGQDVPASMGDVGP
jgi:hypothetical protein